MVRKAKQLKVKKSPSAKIADAKRIRFGGGMAPAVLAREAAAEVSDSRKIRFGGGMMPAVLRK